MSIESALLIAGAYLVGSIPAAYLTAKLFRGIDIRQYGTGNVGIGNLWKMTSRRLTIPVIFFDLGKGAAMVWAAQLSGMDINQQVAAGLATIIGHNWPIFLRFSGGRGVLTTLGVALILMPWTIAVFAAFVIFTLLVKSSPLPALGGIAVLPLVSWGLGKPLPVILGFLAMLVIVVIRRLTAPPSAEAITISKKQLLFNRLLFDRDIKDRDAWVHRIPPGASITGQAQRQKKRQRKK